MSEGFLRATQRLRLIAGAFVVADMLRMADPIRRQRIAKFLFVASIVLAPPALFVTWVWPKAGVLILQLVSFLALTFTAWDILQTADVRVSVDTDSLTGDK